MNFVAFFFSLSLLVLTAWVCFQEWIRERSAKWYKLRAEIEKNSTDYTDDLPAPWQDQSVMPWYVRLHEWLEN